MQAPPLSARKLADDFLLVGPFEIETTDIGPAGHLELADTQHVATVRQLVEHRLVGRKVIPTLVDVSHIDGRADVNGAAIGLLGAGDHAEQGRFTGAVGANDADDGAGRNGEGEFVDE